MKQLQLFKHPIAAALTLGGIGSVAMILMNEFASNGPIILISLIVPLVFSVLTIKLKESDNKPKKLFLSSFFTYIIIFFIYMVYVFFRDTPFGNPMLRDVSFLEIIKLVTLNLLIAIISCAVLTFLVMRKL